jgi:hypothetical protein
MYIVHKKYRDSPYICKLACASQVHTHVLTQQVPVDSSEDQKYIRAIIQIGTYEGCSLLLHQKVARATDRP